MIRWVIRWIRDWLHLTAEIDAEKTDKADHNALDERDALDVDRDPTVGCDAPTCPEA